ncbi:RNA-binding protein [Escherichia phage vB_EcoS_IME347]|uniref:DUF3850 domain-containing protein n=1 Tax=Escherichia phage vB_EcoS_IME347 TaxID=2496546 RepID=A0A2S1GS40_9CAUD|nr:RNA-binding protein [Escherichia phage vB_EcoS_IME347]AWD92214.1 hypothetical protein [Escherichia phage vB_EcoS_IME347]
MNNLHELKIFPRHFYGVKMGQKKAEFRVDDRGFKTGDTLRLREWHEGDFTGREISVVVTDVTDVTEFINRANAELYNGNRFVMLSFFVVHASLCDIPYIR